MSKIKNFSAVRILFISIIALVNFSSPAFGQVTYGFGKSYSLAYANAQAKFHARESGIRLGEALGTMMRDNMQTSSDLKRVRGQYWRSKAAGKNVSDLEDEYLRLLESKDDFYFAKYFTREILNKVKPNEDGTVFKGGGDLVVALYPDIDGGIGAYENAAHQTWLTISGRSFGAVLEYLASRSPANYDQKILNDAWERFYTEYQELYSNYVRQRNLSEAMFKNPYSPLLSKDNLTFLRGHYSLVEKNSSRQQIAKTTDRLVALAGRQNVLDAVDQYRTNIRNSSDLARHYDYLSSGKDYNYLFETLQLEYLILKNNPEAFSYYLLRRFMRLDWSQITDIREHRIKRLGVSAVKIAELDAFNNGAGRGWAGKCSAGKNEIFPSYSRDCVAIRLDHWPNILDLHSVNVLNMNSQQMKQEIVNDMGDKETADSLYQKIVDVVPENLLLASWYQWKFNDSHQPLISYHHGVYSPEKSGSFIRLLRAFSRVVDHGTFAMLTYHREAGEYDELWSHLSKMVDIYNQDVEKFGAESILVETRKILTKEYDFDWYHKADSIYLTYDNWDLHTDLTASYGSPMDQSYLTSNQNCTALKNAFLSYDLKPKDRLGYSHQAIAIFSRSIYAEKFRREGMAYSQASKKAGNVSKILAGLILEANDSFWDALKKGDETSWSKYNEKDVAVKAKVNWILGLSKGHGSFDVIESGLEKELFGYTYQQTEWRKLSNARPVSPQCLQ